MSRFGLGLLVGMLAGCALFMAGQSVAGEPLEYKEAVAKCEKYKDGGETMRYPACINHYITGSDGEYKPIK